MDEIWLSSYPPYVARKLTIPPHLTLVEIFQQACVQFEQKAAYTSFNATLTYRQLADESRALAAFFQQKWQLEKGSRIAVMLPNILQYPVVFFAALQAGLVVVPINPMYTERELKMQLKDADVQAIVLLSQMASKLEKVLPYVPIAHVMITDFCDYLPFSRNYFVHFYVKWFKKSSAFHLPQAIYFKDVMAVGKELTFKPILIESDDLALLQYTGGTTGLPRGVMLTHHNVSANILQTKAWVEKVLENAKEKVALAPLPFYHIFALMANNLLLMHLGFENILIADPRRVGSIINILRKRPLVLMTGVNTLYNAMILHPKFKHLNFSMQIISLAGGMSLQKTVAQQWKQITGKWLIEAYGLSECSPAVLINPLEMSVYKGAMGLPLPNTAIKICDERGKEVGIDAIGELCVKGPQVMKGYWQNPHDTASTFTPDGFLMTGDLVKMDKDGYIYFVDRKKDMLIVSGFNVYPNEIEDVISMHPGVKEAAIIGEPDPVHGNRILCYVVKEDPNLTKAQLFEFLTHELTGYKRPHTITFVDNLPKTTVGKISHRVLRTQHENKTQ